MIFRIKDDEKEKNDNKNKVIRMFIDYSESDTPYISQKYISEILDIPVNRVRTILNNLIIQNIIKYDPETNKYYLKNSSD